VRSQSTAAVFPVASVQRGAWNSLPTSVRIRVVRGSIFIDPAQPNPPNNWPNPTQTTARWNYGPMTQPNPYPIEPPYIDQQLACRKKISLCTSCHHHHPNTHRNNANTHSITSITVILGLFQTDEACTSYKFSQNEVASRYSTQSYIYTWHVFFRTSAISDPRPNPTH